MIVIFAVLLLVLLLVAQAYLEFTMEGRLTLNVGQSSPPLSFLRIAGVRQHARHLPAWLDSGGVILETIKINTSINIVRRHGSISIELPHVTKEKSEPQGNMAAPSLGFCS